MRVALIVLLVAALAVALPTNDVGRIIGGSDASIEQYPFAAALLYSDSANVFTQACAGAIVNNRSILTVAYCFFQRDDTTKWLTRAGSASASNGGMLFSTQSIIIHPSYNIFILDMNFALVRVAGAFTFGERIASVGIASSTYFVADGTALTAVGWGATEFNGVPSETLQHVEVYSVNLRVCRERYDEIAAEVTHNSICAGVLDVGGRDHCQGDQGGPLLHNGVLIGVNSWNSCGYSYMPGVSARVSSATDWIVQNA